MKFLFVIDPIEKLNFETESTIEIMNESAKSNIQIYYCECKDLFFEHNKVYANSTLIKIKNKICKKIKTQKQELDYFAQYCYKQRTCNHLKNKAF